MDQSAVLEGLHPSAIRAQLARMERSVYFAGSVRLLVLLRFIVSEVLEGRAISLKEATIGNVVYEREPPYDPRIDSTVRVEARRLRRKLQTYYEGEGRADAVRIALPTGCYVPTFALLEDKKQEEADTPQGAIIEKGRHAALAIMPFRALSTDAADQSFADGLTDELIFSFGRSSDLRVVSRGISFQYKDRPYSVAGLARELGIDAILHGSVRRAGNVLRITMDISDPNGFIVASDRCDVFDDEPMRIQERIAAFMMELAGILHPVCSAPAHSDRQW